VAHRQFSTWAALSVAALVMSACTGKDVPKFETAKIELKQGANWTEIWLH